MLKHVLTLTAAACVAVSCSEKEPVGFQTADCFGRLALDSSIEPSVQTRAEIDLKSVVSGLKVPSKTTELVLVLAGKNIRELKQNEAGQVEETGKVYDDSWTYVGSVEYDEPDLFPADEYTATFSYGDPEAIGVNRPYYYGFRSGLQVEIGEVTHYSVPVKIVNSIVRVQTDDIFKGYFSDPEFKLVVDGTETQYLFHATSADTPIFVPAGAQVGLKGVAYRPSQTGSGKGETIEFEVPARTMSAGTLHTFRFTAEAGSLQVEVVFEDFQDGGDSEIETNPDYHN